MSTPILQLKDASIYQGDSLVLSEVNVEINKGDGKCPEYRSRVVAQ